MDTEKYREYKDFIRANLPEWEGLEDEDIEMERLSGITNMVFLASTKKNVSPNNLIFRKFSSREGIVDREKESKVFMEMSKRGVGPKCYGGNSDFRLEEYFHAVQIKNKEYNQPDFRRKLAIAIAKLHKVQIEDLDKTTMLESALKDPKYFEVFDKKCAENIFTKEEREKINEVQNASSKEEREFIENILPKNDIVFSHNDLLAGNVLVGKENKNILFIDFEYGAYNFRGFDIGNMFKESIINYSIQEPPYFQFEEENFPSDEDLAEFLRYYIAFSDMNDNEIAENHDKFVNSVEEFNAYVDKKYQDKGELKKRVGELFRETKIGVMLSHYYWLIWAVKMSKTPDTDFDYVTFSYESYKGYLKVKEEIRALDSANLV